MLYYLATPYTKDPRGITSAFVDACRLAAKLLQNNIIVYSPIAHTHPIALHGGIDPLDLSIWLPFDAAMIKACDALLIARMPGWQESRGIAHELKEFTRAGKPVFNIDPDTLKMRTQ